MLTSIYKGRKAPDTYLFLPVRDDLSAVPADILRAMGEPVHIMDIVLTPRRRLARGDALQVMRMLLTKGCYVQMPPRHPDAVTGGHADPRANINGTAFAGRH